jgi:hypothetical protein
MSTDRVTKRKLTLAEAAVQWERAKLEIERQKPLVEEAAKVLLDHFEKTGSAAYKNRIGWTWRGDSLILDQPKVRAYLAEKLSEFQKRTERTRSLVLLGKDA